MYLFIKGVADWRAPLGMFLSISIFSSIFYFLDSSNGSVLFHLCSGGVLFGLFFMVTDPVTTSITKSGRLIFGIICGLVIMIIRKWAGLPEGVMYSILFMNAFTPLINKLTKPKAFGVNIDKLKNKK